MGEKDFKKLINKETEELHIPESLHPEAVEQRLQDMKRKKKHSMYKGIAAAAACCVVVAGVGVVLERTSGDTTGLTLGESSNIVKEQDSGVVTEIASAEDYDQIYDWIDAKIQANRASQAKAYGVAESASADTASVTTASVTMASSEEGYSDTNVREEGVGEADIIKTDGKNLYILNGNQIQIVGIESDEMEPLGTIELESESYFAELYVKDSRVVVFYTLETYEDHGDGLGKIYRQETIAEIFDTSNPSDPQKVTKISQSGNYNSMRAVGDYIYLFSDFYTDISLGRDGISTYIPEIQGETVASDNIFMPSSTNSTNYTVISAFSLQNPEEQIDRKAVFGSGGLFYVSSENIYICETLWNSGDNDLMQTCIRKLSYEDGKITPIGQTRIDGTLNNSYSIDEYDGYLRMVVTIDSGTSNVMPLAEDLIVSTDDVAVEEYTTYNSLYILDENLEEVSRIENLAPDEQVYSARFMGDAGYFVTYRQMDPLFSVDLSDPENPEILGELKIPGFSEYLHPYGEGLLLGIGMDVDETGTVTNGVKVSMFDISDPTEVQEVEKYVIEEAYSTDVSYNYKAALVDAEENLIGFTAYCDGGAKYYVFSYEEDGFTCELEKNLLGYNSNVRGIYAGDKFYIVTSNTVESFTLDSFDKIDDVVL